MATPLIAAHILVQDTFDDASNLAQLVVKFDPQGRAILPGDATGELTTRPIRNRTWEAASTCWARRIFIPPAEILSTSQSTTRPSA
jgi:hypothetical protein